MTDTSESFVQEVSEELRKDQLMGYAKRYGWILVAIVVGAVGTTAYLELERSKQQTAAEESGEALLGALNLDESANRVEALATIASGADGAAVLAGFLSAQELLDSDQRAEALIKLDQLATDASVDPVYRDLASLKATMIRGSELSTELRHSTLDDLAGAGRPFRVAALEQKAIAFIDAGEAEKAITQLNALLQEPNVTQAQADRWQQLIVSLGGEPVDPVSLGASNQ